VNQKTIIDISIPIHAGLAPWPGDVRYELRLESTPAGDQRRLNLGAVTMSLHTGTHIDAPYHFDSSGATVSSLDLEVFIGPASVIDVSGKERIQVRDIEGAGAALSQRVLLKTGAWTDYTQFPESIPVIEPYVPAFLSERGVRLLGIDLPSVDALDSKELPNHHALASRGIHILESIDLRAADPGQYELLALPLRLELADAAPCRAVLLRSA
jgi:arylformamidase